LPRTAREAGRALLISLGNPGLLVTSPISAAFLLASLVLLALIAVPLIRTKREEVMQE
jgi:TctA family transporter